MNQYGKKGLSMKVHPQVINKGRKAEFVVLPINEYNEIISRLEEQQDLDDEQKINDDC